MEGENEIRSKCGQTEKNQLTFLLITIDLFVLIIQVL